VRYWSPVKYKGHTTTRLIVPAAGVGVAPAETELDFPVEWTVGYAWMPDEKWLFEIDLAYTGWSSFERLEVSSPAGNLVEPLRWEDSLKVMAGFTRSWESGWWVGGGYWYAETTSPDLTFNPRLPDVDLHVISLGAGYRTECWAAELTYQFGYGNSREIRGGLPVPPTGTVADGKMTYQAHGLSAGARWFF
jgi:long-chain fatty acid transport protein